jgi:hypothetical protein
MDDGLQTARPGEAAAPLPPPAAKHSSQPQVVFEFLDAITQQQYYYNVVTGESTFVPEVRSW